MFVGHISNPQHHWEPHTSFAEAEVYFKKELPGRTMEFTYDLSQTPVIERRHKRTGLPSSGFYDKDTDIKEAATSPRRSLSLSTADSATFSGWKRPWMSQVRNKERFFFLISSTSSEPCARKSCQSSEYNWSESWSTKVSFGE